MNRLSDVLTFAGVPERIAHPEYERFVTVRLNGGGAVKRSIGQGKTPVPFTGYRIRAGQLIYSRIDARNGAFALVPPELDGAVVSKDFPIFSIAKDLIQPSYLSHYLRAGSLQRSIRALSLGATNRQRITEERLLGFPLPLPPLTEQRRITAILDQADLLRPKRRHHIKQLDALCDAALDAILSGTDVSVMDFGQCVDFMRNGVSPATAGSHASTVLTLSAITQGRFDPNAVKVASFAAEPPDSARVDAGDFLVCRGNGNRKLVGVGVHSDESHPELVFPDTVIAARVLTEKLDLSFLEVAWRQGNVRRQLETSARTTNGTHKVNQQVLGSIKLAVPPIELQRKFAAHVAAINAQRELAERSLATLDELFASLQARAFSGQL